MVCCIGDEHGHPRDETEIHSLEQELLIETGTTQLPRYVQTMLEEEGSPDDVLNTKLEEQIDRMFQEKLIDTAEALAMKENLVDNASATVGTGDSGQYISSCSFLPSSTPSTLCHPPLA